ncbi:MAG: methanogen output domain 1-containing protein [Vulcanimicrobiaceae bacterium]|jgi:predicted ArsR family transcriptional regulator
MQTERFFATTKGRIAAELRRRKSASAADLALELALSPNAIRQQLAGLQQDGLVSERPVRRGKTKPTHEFSLTSDGERLFPQRYDLLLNAVLREVRDLGGDDAVREIFERMGRRAAEKMSARAGERQGEERVGALVDLLREHGVEADYNADGKTYEIREHNCPYAETVKEHPQVCSVIHTVLGDLFPAGSKQTESLATGGEACRFEVKV